MSVNAVSVPFPPAPGIGDEYSIWKFDGLYWLLNGEKNEGDVTWESIADKPASIASLGIDNEVDSATYESSKGIEKDKASKSWSKNK